MSDVLRVLVVEDSPADAKLILRELARVGRPITSERVETRSALREALVNRPWDLVISDWSMPTLTALDALALVRELGVEAPFIIVSGTVGEESAVEAMRAGAHDFVLKDRLARLTPAAERELRECAGRHARRQAEAALRESEARFRRLSESGVIGIVVAHLDGSILEVNDAYLALLGYSRDEVANGSVRWESLTPPEERETSTRRAESLAVAGATAPRETELLRKDGSRVAVLVGAAMLEHPRCIAFVADLTERNQANAARARAELALRASEDQLRHAQKMEGVGRLAGGVAHDFNNILSVILSYAELLLEAVAPDSAVHADVHEIRTAATRAAGLTRQLLMFSRHQVLEPKVMDLHQALDGMENMLQRMVGEDVELSVVPPPAPGRIEVDPSHLEQIVLNLVVNARDAMPTGGKITLETSNVELDEDDVRDHPTASTGPHVQLVVSDNGSGMDGETRARIFEPFFTTKGLGEGTGLGLSMVFGIVQRARGSIWVHSEPGNGTTFRIQLPRVEADVDVDVPFPPPISTSLRGSEAILVVEDDDQVRATVVDILERQGYRVVAASNAAEALRHSQDTPTSIDLLLTDVVMPDMSGPELAKRLVLLRPQLKVLCMSGYTDDRVVRHGVLESGVALLQKPLTPHALLSKLREVLDA